MVKILQMLYFALVICQKSIDLEIVDVVHHIIGVFDQLRKHAHISLRQEGFAKSAKISIALFVNLGSEAIPNMSRAANSV